MAGLSTFWVLVLNQTFEPLHVCPARRAVTMLLRGRAEKVEEDGYVVRSPSMAFRLPSVIRLRRYISLPRWGEIAFSKKNVFKRDRYACQYCGVQAKGLTIDHVLSRSRGGKTTWDNVVTACRPCNAVKGDRTLAESEFRLLRSPVRPYFLLRHYAYSGQHQSTLSSWDKYLHPRRARRP